MVTIILLIVLGIILFLIEFLLIPGITVAGIGGFICLAIGTYLSFTNFGMFAGIMTLLVILIFIPVLIYLVFRSKASKSVMLETEIDGQVKLTNEGDFNIDDEGETISRLNPIGKAKFNNKVIEARSTGNYIDAHTKVKIIKLNRNQAIVEPIID